MMIDTHAVLLALLGAGGSLVGWLLLRSVHGIDEKLTDLADDVRDLGHGQAHHGERLVRLETRAGLDPLPPPPTVIRKAQP